MALSPGTRLGPYEILAPLGAGGMGEVYKARDTRLQRSVAIKILSPDLAHDAEYRDRFQIEARAVSSLNHPHICALYDVGEVPMPVVPDTSHQPLAIRHDSVASVAISDDVVRFLVMELLEGNTLAQRLMRGPLPFDEALRTAIEIASALDAAHAQGVTHRDLKPSNVMLTKSGAKLLDFGLAKLHHVAHVTGLATRTFDPSFTTEGAVLGTFHYMAPEQVEGKAVDARADLFAFGALLYEMVTGRKAFEGQSQASLTASILAREPPPLSDSVTTVPPSLDHVIRRCLRKDPEERWQSARDVVFELKWIAERVVEQPAARPTGRRAIAVAWSVAGAAALVATATLVLHLRQPVAAGVPVRLDVLLPEGSSIAPRTLRTILALSPDGRHVAFTAVHEGRSQLWLRSLDTQTARVLPGTDGAVSPFWSPDSRFVGFLAGGKLQRVEMSGGPPRPICDTAVDSVPTWGRNGTILFSSADRGGIFRVSADGGPVTQVTRVDRSRQEREHFWPSFLPDGIHFFYVVASDQPDPNTGENSHAVYVASLDDPGVTRVADVKSRMTYAAPGHVLYSQDGALLARRFDLATLRLTGDPVPIAERLWYYRPTGLAEFSVSDNGVLSFRDSRSKSELVWFDRAGVRLETVGAPAAFDSVRLSPDGRKIAVEQVDPRSGSGTLWIYDRNSGIPQRFTLDPGEASYPVWSGDGADVFFRGAGSGPPDLYRKRADGRGAKEPLIELGGVQSPADASLDGRHLVYWETKRGSSDLWVLPLAGPRTPTSYLATPAEEGGARFSPDGRWLAFVSTESGGPEIYVAPLDEPGARQRVSVAGGSGPRWRRDGRELVYLSLDNTLMAVAVRLGQEFKRETPRALFTAGPVLRLRGANGWADPAYDISADGQRFLVNRVIDDASRAPITVVLNWPALLRK